MVRPEGYGVQYPFDAEQPTIRGVPFATSKYIILNGKVYYIKCPSILY